MVLGVFRGRFSPFQGFICRTYSFIRLFLAEDQSFFAFSIALKEIKRVYTAVRAGAGAALYAMCPSPDPEYIKQ